MSKKLFSNKLLMVSLVFCLIFAFSAESVFAWGGHGHDQGRYYWYHDRWYAPGWFGFGVAVSALTIGAVVAGLPYGYKTVVVSGQPYY
jgi:hypothetical protein